ncbi:Heat stress transcription factor B-4c [Acorus gramineus]|uniref:Heat stress transcription factor B-4c n=1 Tax=Acorus gramineus TaxID=55184 RepID=A0AAV9BR28_ACOGR|nr:Heat stress transcription factor B-4c [Acorus gramineus]
MRRLYNDIIYFVQNHVSPVTPSESYNPHNLLAKKCFHYRSSGSATSSSSLTNIADDEGGGPNDDGDDEDGSSSRPRLFGVPLHCKKRLLLQGESAEVEPKARLGFSKEELGFSLMPTTSPC